MTEGGKAQCNETGHPRSGRPEFQFINIQTELGHRSAEVQYFHVELLYTPNKMC